MTPAVKRSDALRNRELILSAARSAFAEQRTAPSNAEICRRAGVGMATLYRNFPTRLELLEALYAGEAELAFTPADPHADPTDAFLAWLGQFASFAASKRHVATELLTHGGSDSPVFDDTKSRVIAAGRPLLAAAVDTGALRADLSLEQILQLVVSVAALDHASGAMLATVFDGLRRRS